VNIVLWIIASLLAVAFLGAGAMKLTQSKEKLGANPNMGWTESFSPGVIKMIGALEVLAALGLILPAALGIVPVLTPLAALGLVLVLDLVSGAHLAWSGVAWSLAAMVGATAYFLISADSDSGLPPLALAGVGLLVGAAVLAILAVVGLLPMRATTQPAHFALGSAPWWVPLTLLGLVTAAVAYATGIAAIRRLGSRVASFVALLEVVAAVGFAWLLVDQLPGVAQLLGGLLIISGVVAVRLGDRQIA